MPQPNPWRIPGAEIGGYPGLEVYNMIPGSITIEGSRPRFAALTIIRTALTYGWDVAEKQYRPSRYGWDAQRMGEFLYHLLKAPGGLGWLLLVLAEANRLDEQRPQEVFQPDDPDEPVVNITPRWWAVPELRQPVVEQLRRCLAELGDETDDA
jgi:hypothetical protein